VADGDAELAVERRELRPLRLVAQGADEQRVRAGRGERRDERRELGRAAPVQHEVDVVRRRTQVGVEPTGETGQARRIERELADEQQAPRREDARDGARLGSVFSQLVRERPASGHADPEAHVNDPRLRVAVELEARVREHAQHRPIAGQRVGGEASHSALARELGELLEEQGPESAALILVRDDERDLRGDRRGAAVIAGERDHALADLGDEHHVAREVDAREALEDGRRQAHEAREVAEVHGLQRERAMEGGDARSVARSHCADACAAAVREQHVACRRRGEWRQISPRIFV